MAISKRNIKLLNSKSGLLHLLSYSDINLSKTIRAVKYEARLNQLQQELIKLQHWVSDSGSKVVVIFEGRDAAGKGGAIRRFVEFLNPREYRVVALPKPDEIESTQWYFQRYINRLPKAGEIVFFDRSWYNRAVVEPVNEFCSDEEYEIFMNQVNHVEKMLVESGTYIIKLYFSISKDEQQKRFIDMLENPIKMWKYSEVDSKALDLWDNYTQYKERMFEETNTEYAPWKVIKANRKSEARVDAIEYVLNFLPYEGKNKKIVKHRVVDRHKEED